MSRWKGVTFKEYIWDELSSYASGMSKAMKQCFNYIIITSGAFTNISNTTRDRVQRKYVLKA